ncbi:MAG TPA: hypothetical protein VN700_07400 [Vicinamibacterales bacterium]|nr:hypothetical protein [Vicinamibacterales bacterium]
MRRRLASTFISLWLIASVGCGPQPDLSKDLKLLPGITGYFDDGVKAGLNRILPSITFQLKNEGQLPITNVDLVAAYWEVGADGEIDSKQIRGISGAALEPGATSETITVRSSVGYTHEGPRADMFTNTRYKGFIVKVFAKRSGKTTKLGEFPIEARLLPAVQKDGSRP